MRSCARVGIPSAGVAVVFSTLLACGGQHASSDGGVGGQGGTGGGAGGTAGSGGTSVAGSGGTSTSVTGSGGLVSTGGAGLAGGSGSGGNPGTGGKGTGGNSIVGSGGKTGGGSGSATGGAAGAGGIVSSGGVFASGGITGAGGTVASGGVVSSGGVDASGGVTATGGTAGNGGAGGSVVHRASACEPGAQYSAPTLTGPAKLLYQPSGSSSGTYEGPVWLAGNGVLLFSDMTFTSPVDPAQMLELTPPSTTTTFLADSGTNGMAVDANGVVFACSHKVQGIVKLDFAAAKLTTVVDNYQGKKFNSPNDIVIRSDGTIYFTDPDYQLGNRTSETGKKGVYRVSPSGTASLVDDTFNEPNGITLSPDETILYVADYTASVVRTFTVAADGSTSGRKDFVSVSSPDGFAMDCLGNLYVASGGSASTIQVFSPSGSKIASLPVGSSLSNMAFGGSNGKTLYITAGKALYSLDMNLPGYPY
jgi:gluconolactonase